MTRQNPQNGEIPFFPISEMFKLVKRKLIHYGSLIRTLPADVQVNQTTASGVLWSIERPSEPQGPADDTHRV